jgi:predicted ATPase/class 3 adenylate cyclase
VTLLFSDIEGSTRLLASLGGRYTEALADHRRIVREIISSSGGVEVNTQGDAFLIAFETADDAVDAAVRIQRRLAAHLWPSGTELRVRIGMHTGRPERDDEDYVGMDLHVGARICAAAHGGQVVLSSTTWGALAGEPAEGVRLRSLGQHYLKDIEEPLHLFDLQIDGLPSDFPNLRALESGDSNLPVELPELLFRDTELAAAVKAFRADGARLVTLTGAGGTGKTTLAMHVAKALTSANPDGVVMVPLAPVADSALVPSAVAEALGLREQPNRSVTQTVLDYLAGRRCLLFLDNFEHLPQAAGFVQALLSTAPGVRVLLTSRTPTRLAVEHELIVNPLSLSSDRRAVSPAVELFARRARSARSSFHLDESNREFVEQICERLDGLPLAIELVAARVRLLPPAAILQRLDRPFEVAAGGPRNRDNRQQTLHATIEWGYDLLPPDRQQLLAALGVFAGRFSLDAAQAVCDASLDGIADLLDNSLLRAVETDTDEPRLELLFTIRAFARERLEASGSAEAVMQRLADWCAGLGRAAGPRLLDGAHEGLLARFDAEQDDLRVVLEWLLATGRAEAALSLAADLAIFWDTRGQWGEGRERLEAALLAAPDAPEERRAKALFNLGRCCLQQGDVEQAEVALQQALSHYEKVDDPRSVVLCISHLAWTAAIRPGRAEEATRLGESALQIARASGDPWTIAVALNNLADDDFLKVDDVERRHALLSESAALRRQLGERRTLAITLDNLGKVELMRGRLPEGESALREALELATAIGFLPIMASAKSQLGGLALARGDLDSAQRLLAEALQIGDRHGDIMTKVQCMRALAKVAERRGDHTESSRLTATAAGLAEAKGILL